VARAEASGIVKRKNREVPELWKITLAELVPAVPTAFHVVHVDTGLPRCYPALHGSREVPEKFLASLVAHPDAVLVWEEEEICRPWDEEEICAQK
jgi:hypothetical protein